MNNTAPQSALREWRDHLSHPTRAVSLAAIVVILALTGPFGTADIIRVVPRLVYWAVIVVLCYSAGYAANELAERWASTLWQRLVIAAALTSIGVLVIVYVLNGVAIGFWATGIQLVVIAANVAAISATITIAFTVVEQSQTSTDVPTARAAILDRIPFDKRGSLVSIRVEDHYVRIRTTMGEEMVLLRLADAMREVGDTRGLQVYRSHWIALEQVRAATRKGDGAILTLTHGPDIPVSRANVPAIREAGLLPRT